jgi:hypothetical protein
VRHAVFPALNLCESDRTRPFAGWNEGADSRSPSQSQRDAFPAGGEADEEEGTHRAIQIRRRTRRVALRAERGGHAVSHRGIRCLLLAAAVTLVATPTMAWGAAPSSGATLTVAPSTIQFEVRRDKFFQDRSDTGTATGTLLVSNTGTRPVTITITGYFSDGESASPQPTTPELRIPGGQSSPITVSMTWSHDLENAGTLIVDSNKTPAVSVPFVIKEVVPGRVLFDVLLWSAILGALTCIGAHFAIRWGARPPNTNPPKLTDEVEPAQTWSFSGSWASNLTALGAILGTVLAATGFLTDVVPGISTGMFVAISLLFGFLVLVAPVIFVAMHDRSGKPSYLGLLVAATFTLWAAIGELASVAQLTARAGLSPSLQAAPWIVVAVLMIVLGAYTRTSIAQVIHRSKARTRQRARAAAEAKAAEIDIPVPPAAIKQVVDAAVNEIDFPLGTSAML